MITDVQSDPLKIDQTEMRDQMPMARGSKPKPTAKIKKRAKYRTTKRIRVFSKRFEKEIVYRILVAIEMGYHITIYTLKAFIKLYFDRIGLDCEHFEHNMPTNEFAEQFLRRHRKVLGQKIDETCQYGRLYTLDVSMLSKRVSAGTDLLDILDKCFFEILAEIQ